MNKIEISEKLKAARLKSGLTQKQVADEVGKSPKLIGHWETGYSQPDADTLGFLFHLYNLSANDFFETESIQENLSASEMEHIKKYRSLDGHGKEMVDYVLEKEHERAIDLKNVESLPENGENTIILMKYLTPVSAGTGEVSPFDDQYEEIRAQKNMYTEQADFVVRVKGNSMEPKFHDNDLLLIDTDGQVGFGEIGIFFLNGNSYVKQLGAGELISLNPEYSPIRFDDAGIDCFSVSDDCEGKVICVLDPGWIV